MSNFLHFNSNHADRDIREAVEYYWSSYVSEPAGTICFRAQITRMTLREILRWDDYSSWGEFSKGELVGVSENDMYSAFTHYRGKAWAERALGWMHSTIPPIVLVDGEKGRCVGDGRGRINVAVALDLSFLDVIILTEALEGQCFTFNEWTLR